uniref:RING-type domain-containing protein n=1 Tax=Panagrellus redivivus TaxID=6233 RepID=A0A7E4VKS6_PANRE
MPSAVGQCTICFELIKPQDISSISKCGHTFHCQCILQWFERSPSCPMCRISANSHDLVKIFIAEAEDDSDDDDADSVTSSSTSTTTTATRAKRIPVRCRFWPKCDNKTCPFVHPRKLCITFAAKQCFRGDQCHFIHPQCAEGNRCRDPQCNYSHVLQNLGKPKTFAINKTSSSSLASLPDIGRLSIDSNPRRRPNDSPQTIRCRFNTLCRNDKCKFVHPKKCRHDTTCDRAVCTLWHPKRNAVRAGA